MEFRMERAKRSNKWGDAKSYDLCLNSSYLGIDGSVDLIKKVIAMKESEK